MSDMEVAVGLGWETSPDLAASCREVSFSQSRLDLRVFARLVERS
jgi:hypothetical protein